MYNETAAQSARLKIKAMGEDGAVDWALGIIEHGAKTAKVLDTAYAVYDLVIGHEFERREKLLETIH